MAKAKTRAGSQDIKAFLAAFGDPQPQIGAQQPNGFFAEVTQVRALLVQVKNAATKTFYLKCAAFQEFPADSRSLFLPMARLISALRAE